MAFPKTIYVKEVSDTSSREKYLDAYYTLFDSAEDDAILVGVYKLVGKKKVKKVVEVSG